MTALAHFRSDDFVSGERVAALHDIYAAVERVDIDIIGESAPFFDVATRSLPDVTLLEAAISPMAPKRTRAQANDGKDDLVLAFITAGKVRFSPEGGEEIELRAGDAYLGINTRASQHTLVDAPQFFDITIPRAALEPVVRCRDYASLGRIEPGPALTLLQSYGQALMQIEEPIGPDLARRSADHLIDLAALALGARPDAAEQASKNGLAHARLGAIKADIRRHLADDWMTLDEMARRHGISPQYLRALFYKDGTSFSDYVRSQRLGRAGAMLADPTLADWRISQIAFASGFGDLSHFNKLFRRHFGLSPSDYRAAAQHKRLK